MKFRVHFLDPKLRTAVVVATPSWLERWLFGREQSERVVFAIQSTTGGLRWLYDSTLTEIAGHRLLCLIHAERAYIEWRTRQADRMLVEIRGSR